MLYVDRAHAKPLEENEWFICDLIGCEVRTEDGERLGTVTDVLQPGANERWTLRVLKHGKPADASIIATMYDASLDKFGKHNLPFSLSYDREVPPMIWDIGYRSKFFARLSKSYNRFTVVDQATKYEARGHRA